jgi:hypothetical protein
MFNTQGGSYSLADIAAATGGTRRDDGMFGGGNDWWIILLFLFLMNGWGGGWNGGGRGASTREEVAYGFDMNGLENGIRGIQQGLCDGFYAMNTGMLNGFSGVQSTLCQGFAGVTAGMNGNTNDIIRTINADTIANMQNTNAINAGITGLGTQLAQCCCDNKYNMATSFADLNYNLATQACDTRRAITDSTRDIIDSNNAGVRAVLDFLTKDKIDTLTAENQALKFAASQSAQNAYLVGALKEPCPIPAYFVPNPNCCYTGVGYGLTRNACGTDFVF